MSILYSEISKKDFFGQNQSCPKNENYFLLNACHQSKFQKFHFCEVFVYILGPKNVNVAFGLQTVTLILIWRAKITYSVHTISFLFN